MRDRIAGHRVAHAARVLVSAWRRNNLFFGFVGMDGERISRKVRNREDALANTRDTRATQSADLLACLPRGGYIAP